MIAPLLFLMLLGIMTTKAQDRPEPKPMKRNIVYVGPSVFALGASASLTYERIFGSEDYLDYWTGGIAAGYAGHGSLSESFEQYFIKFYGGFLKEKRPSNYLEFNFGLILAYDIYGREEKNAVYPSLYMGYRHMPKQGGFNWRVGIGAVEIIQLSAGYSF